ncbi:hypothetical protein Drose_29445 [Dactylosporangium roseum]|uniref:Uncharacterized protein n=1 Tax=Dactylosporangium roseum TaxID=47989 RepID=A0ABY5YZP6_9ACTN|nr:hypothetical protein [Dactylosporangium roseum]UWZ35244.1 hypothetical protein Drose_29445 [Dactylosporangium roseum]
MARLAMSSPLAPVVAALEGLRRRHPDVLACIVPGLFLAPHEIAPHEIAPQKIAAPHEIASHGIAPPHEIAPRAIDPQALAVLVVAGWTRARRVPLLFPDATFLNRAGQLGVRRADVAVLVGDPVAGRPGVVVARDKGELLAIVQDNLCVLAAGPGLASKIRELTEEWSTPHHEQRDLHLGGRAGAVERHHP